MFRLLHLAMPCVFLLGCASTLPAWSGGSATPTRRGDIAVGAAARVPTGSLRNTSTLMGSEARRVEAGGIVPAAMGRYGLGGGRDLGLLVAGIHAGLTPRREPTEA